MAYNQLNKKNIFRWIFFIPLAVGIYIFSAFCLKWIFAVINLSVFKDLHNSDDFRGHYILGFLFIFLFHGISTGLSVYSGVYLAPNYKKIIFAFFLILWGLNYIGFYAFHIDVTIEGFSRTLTEIVASFIGIMLAGVYIWRGQKQIEKKI